ncbi:hypothetical protein ElyMa_002443500 [Elysia marginata]|uniref:DUF4203 domain-containing protein n=1 Tax=Elysia marginata TaxID=1093978 RepID=A0AAV4GKN6_9GAST|nr:hypothetical protein ElyMa_002443500 [Elysia marginata]
MFTFDVNCQGQAFHSDLKHQERRVSELPTMKTVLLAMTEEQHDKRSWRANALIGMFLALSLALSFSVRQQSALARHAIAIYNNNNLNNRASAAAEAAGQDTQTALDPDKTLLMFTASIAILQAVVTGISLTADAPSIKGELPDKEALVIVAIAHAGSTFLRDFLSELGVTSNEPTTVQDVAFFAPVLALAALWLVTSLPAKPVTWMALFMAGFGCSMISTRVYAASTSAATVVASNRAALVCGLAFFSAAMRNIVLRHMVHVEGVEVRSRALPSPYSRVDTWAALIGLGAFAVLSVFLLAPEGWGLAALNGAVTCGLSSALFLVTCQVLKVYGVTCTALFGVWALLLEALVTTPLPLRPGVLSCILALLLLAVGHWLYLRNMAEPEMGLSATGERKPAAIHEQYTRLEFLLFASAVVGVIFYVFQPRVSQRDLHTLSYVGLDQVIRRLLSVPSPGEGEAGMEGDDSHAAHAVSMS